jgi:hypothetical protein
LAAAGAAVANDDPTRDRFHQDDGDSACDATVSGTYLNICVHGGEFRKVVATGAVSCTGLRLTEELDLFRWHCVEESDGTVVFYSDGLRQWKGIGHAIDYSVRPLGFLPNHVSIESDETYGAEPYAAQSQPTVWWRNTLHDVIGEGLTAETPNELNGGGTNDIYVVTENITTDGFHLNADQVALVIHPDRVHHYSGANNST